MQKLGMGLMRLPLNEQGAWNDVDLMLASNILDVLIENGFNYFDTAYNYHNGRSEGIIRELLSDRYLREEFMVCDKLPVFLLEKRSDCQKYFDRQLERCGVDYFDTYMLHGIGQSVMDRIEKANAFGFIKEMKDKGRVRRTGFSYHDKAGLLDRLLTEHPEIEVVQLQINYFDMEMPAFETRECYEVCKKHGKDIIVMETLKGGTLAQLPREAEDILKSMRPNDSIASWGFRYAASLDNVIMVLSGMNSLGQITDNMWTFENFEPMTEEEYEALKQVSRILRNTDTIQCTSCKYCISECPKGIAIPDYISLYNDNKRHGGTSALMLYENMIKGKGKPEDCISCGRCEKRCPQHIKIAETMDKISGEFAEFVATTKCREEDIV